jgi:hypothetical protein
VNVHDHSRTAALWLGGIFKSVDWLLPAYLQTGFLHRFAKEIEQRNDQIKIDFFRSVMVSVYNPQYLASFYVERYSKIKYVLDFSVHIDEVFRAYFSGYRRVAITALIPVLEGIIRKMADGSGRDLGNGTQGLIKEFDKIVEDEEKSPHRFEERLVMFELIRDFMKNRFLIKTSRFAGLNQFNRHGILHGVFEDYGDELNFLRMITILDLLCFIIGFRGVPVSVFAAEESDESQKLAVQYLALREKSGKPEQVMPTEVVRVFTG